MIAVFDSCVERDKECPPIPSELYILAMADLALFDMHRRLLDPVRLRHIWALPLRPAIHSLTKSRGWVDTPSEPWRWTEHRAMFPITYNIIPPTQLNLCTRFAACIIVRRGRLRYLVERPLVSLVLPFDNLRKHMV